MRTTLLQKPPLGSTLVHGHPFTRGLLARYLLNEGAGVRLNNIAAGRGGRDSILTLMDPATDWVSSNEGMCLDFDGVDDGCIGEIKGFDTRTATLAVRFRMLAAADTTLIHVEGTPGLRIKTNIPGGFTMFGLATQVTGTGFTYADGRWHEVVGVVDGSASKIYLDGKLIDSTPTAGALLSTGTLRIGHQSVGQFLLGQIGGVRVSVGVLNADEVAWHYRAPYADTHRPLWVFPDRTHTKRELEAYINGDWRNLTQDMLLSPELSIEYGIGGTGPTDRVAGAGRMQWAMNNSEQNSAGLRGYYSHDNANLRPGWKVGIPIRFTYRGVSGATYRKHVGWLASCKPEPFIEAERRAHCVSMDWMAEASKFEPTGIATQVDQTADQVAAALLTGAVRRPAAARFDAGKVVFPYAPDNSRSGEQPILGSFQALAMSEWGYFYLLGDGTLRMENQSARLVPTIKASFSSTVADLQVGQERSRIVNVVKVTVHPRRADGTDTNVLFQLPATGKPPFVPAGEVANLNFRYNDPANRSQHVAGINMQPLVALTDYNMFHNANGGGASMASNFDVAAAFGANDVKLRVKSNAAQGGYITLMQGRGRGLYDYDPYDVEARDEASIALYGVSEIKIDMPLNADPVVAQAVANYVLGQFSSPITADASVSVVAGDPVTEELVHSIEPGDAIAVQETLTGVDFVFFVQHVSLRLPEDGITMAEFLVQRGPLSEYWHLGVAGVGELGQTTVVAPL